jgi:hypothetical protein
MLAFGMDLMLRLTSFVGLLLFSVAAFAGTTENASKLNGYGVLLRTSEGASKLNGYAVLSAGPGLSKLNAYAILSPAAAASGTSSLTLSGVGN